MVNTINNGDCVVEEILKWVHKKYKVRRGIKPNLFEIFCDGKKLNQDGQQYRLSKVPRTKYNEVKL